MNEFADFPPSLLLLSAPRVITIVLCLAVVGTVLDLQAWYAARQRSMAECSHRWIYASAWGEGRFWHRICRDCPRQEVVALEDVPEWWRERERAARASNRRAVRGRGAIAVRRLTRPEKSRLNRPGRG